MFSTQLYLPISRFGYCSLAVCRRKRSCELHVESCMLILNAPVYKCIEHAIGRVSYRCDRLNGVECLLRCYLMHPPAKSSSVPLRKHVEVIILQITNPTSRCIEFCWVSNFVVRYLWIHGCLSIQYIQTRILLSGITPSRGGEVTIDYLCFLGDAPDIFCRDWSPTYMRNRHDMHR